MAITLGLDIGSNSVGSAWVDQQTGDIVVGQSVFPAGVDESEEKRGDPKNAKRRMTRRTRITLARRASRKRGLRLKLIAARLLPGNADEFKKLLEQTDPWALRQRGLTELLTPHEFGRLLLHLAQRRGALGLKIIDPDEADADGAKDDGKVKAAIGEVRKKMRERGARTFGEFVAMIRAERVTPITTDDKRRPERRQGPREYRRAIRNKGGSYEHCADRAMIRDEFARLWEAQKRRGGALADILTDELRLALDNEGGDSVWRHKGLLFGQRRQSWDLGTLGRCVLEPTERCVPHADMFAARYLVVEMLNNLKIIERGKEARPLTPDERGKIKTYLSGPLGPVKSGKQKGQPKRTVTVSDLRELMGWGRASKTSLFRFNIEADEERSINTDWFSREIVHGAITAEKWQVLPEHARHGINRAVLKHDPDDEAHAAKLKHLVMQGWAGLSEAQADALVSAWKRRPRPDAKRLNMSRRAVRNLLTVMDRDEPWPDPNRSGQARWLTQIEARKLIAANADFLDVTTGRLLDAHAKRRYATGAKGATARDRHYMKKHLLKKSGQPVYGPDGSPLHEPPPAPLISNPVVRKAIHEVRRHLVEFMATFGRKPDHVCIELAREAKMGKVDADRLLFKNRLRNRIRNEINHDPTFNLAALTSTQQRAAVDRVILCVQQDGVCALCGNQRVPDKITPRAAAVGQGCELAHIIPRGSGGHNGFVNLVLAHTKCNRDMTRRTPRQFWEEILGGFDKGMEQVERIYVDVRRLKWSEIKTSAGEELWKCYFNQRDDAAKVNQFKKEIKDIQEMTPRQEAATKYAARQVMAYLADALYDGNGLPERGGDRLIFATDGLWTSRLRREWGLFFDRHGARAKGLTGAEENERQEKNRGDHRHHAIDAIVIALGTRQVQIAWEEREQRAEREGVNTADDVQMANYRKIHPLGPPAPFASVEQFREAVRKAVFGNGVTERPVCHRPVKRKLIGALHEETLFGPAPDARGQPTENYTAKKSVLQLDPNHLRLPKPEPRAEALKRLTEHFKAHGCKPKQAKQKAEEALNVPGYKPRMVDAPPGKGGIVRDLALRRRLRACLSGFNYVKRNKQGEPIGTPKLIDPDNFTAQEIEQAFKAGAICQASGVPIRSVVLLRTMTDPVVVTRWATDYATGRRYKVYDAQTGQGDPAAARAYVGGNNHHIEIRADARGNWSGTVVPAFATAQRKLARFRDLRAAGVPKLKTLRRLLPSEREKFRTTLRAVEKDHPLIDRSDDLSKGGRFIMSLCEGEMVWMRRKPTKDNPSSEVGYFVVAKLDKPQGIVLVPHWDARAAGERKDSQGNRVPNSQREQFTATPNDLKALAPPGEPHAVKVRVSPLGQVTILRRD